MKNFAIFYVTFFLGLLGSTFGGFLLDGDILKLLGRSDSQGYYVVSPTHFLPASLLPQNFLSVPIAPPSSGGYKTVENDSTRVEEPPKDKYGPPKNAFKPNRDSTRPPPVSNKQPPKDVYGPPRRNDPPKADYGPPKADYGPPKSEYGPPKAEYGPPSVPQQYVIFKSYIEPTYSFGEIPLFGVPDLSPSVQLEATTVIPEKMKKRKNKGYNN